MASSVARSRELRVHLAEPLEHDLRVARRGDELAGVERGEDRHEVLVQFVDRALEGHRHLRHPLLDGDVGVGHLGGEGVARLLEVVLLHRVLRGDLHLVHVEQLVHLVHLLRALLHLFGLVADAVDVVAVRREVAERARLLAEVAHLVLVLLERVDAAVARDLLQEAAALLEASLRDGHQ